MTAYRFFSIQKCSG